MNRLTLLAVAALWSLSPLCFERCAEVCAEETPQPGDVHSLETAVRAMRVADAPWRAIDWHSSLVEALHRSRAESKPLLCWVFIDRPADDARC